MFDKLKELLQEIVKAIRDKTGSSEAIKVAEIPQAIAEISTTPKLEEKTVTPTKTSQAVEPTYADGYVGLSKVTVKAAPLESAKTITPTNKTQTPELSSGKIGFSSVTVEAIPSEYKKVAISDEIEGTNSFTLEGDIDTPLTTLKGCFVICTTYTNWPCTLLSAFWSDDLRYCTYSAPLNPYAPQDPYAPRGTICSTNVEASHSGTTVQVTVDSVAGFLPGYWYRIVAWGT